MKKAKLTAIIAIVAMFGLSGCTTATPKKDIALQLYSVRADIGKDYNGTLNCVSKMGYTGVEAAGYRDGKFYGKAPAEFKKDIESRGLKLISSHANRPLNEKELASGDYSEARKWWDVAIKAHKEAGIKYIVMPYMKLQNSVADLEKQCKFLNEIGEKCAKVGIKFGYHNHAHEFKKVEDKVVMLDYMIQNTDPKYVFIELDVYWSVIGGQAPADYFKKYPNRFELLHIKDVKELGESGMVGFDAVFNNAKIAGAKHFVVEVERYNHEPKKSVKMSLDYLLNAPFVPEMKDCKFPCNSCCNK